MSDVERVIQRIEHSDCKWTWMMEWCKLERTAPGDTGSWADAEFFFREAHNQDVYGKQIAVPFQADDPALWKRLWCRDHGLSSPTEVGTWHKATKARRDDHCRKKGETVESLREELKTAFHHGRILSDEVDRLNLRALQQQTDNLRLTNEKAQLAAELEEANKAIERAAKVHARDGQKWEDLTREMQDKPIGFSRHLDAACRLATVIWGQPAQEAVAVGEIGELLTLFGRRAQGRDEPGMWQEELADAFIMLRQLAIIHGEEGVNAALRQKLEKLQARLAGNTKEKTK